MGEGGFSFVSAKEQDECPVHPSDVPCMTNMAVGGECDTLPSNVLGARTSLGIKNKNAIFL